MNTRQIILMSRLEQRHWWYRSTHELVEACVLRFAGDGKQIFDAGCGTGVLLKILSKLGAVSGCDENQLAVRLARRKLDSEHKPCVQQHSIEDIYKLEFRKFDCVTCIDVLYHQKVSHWRAALGSLKRLLKPDGHLIVQVAAFPMLHGSHDVAVDGARRFKATEFQSAVTQAGFKIQLCSYRYSHLFPLLLARRLVSRLVASNQNEVSDFEGMFKLPNTGRGLCEEMALNLARLENAAVLKGACMPFGSSLFLVARSF